MSGARRALRPALLAAPLAALAGCGPGDAPPPPPPPPPAATPAVTVALVDSVPFENALTDGVLHRVAVRTAAGVDTLPGVLTAAMPVVVGDSVVYGLRREEDRHVGLFAFDARTRRTRPLPAPPDWVAFAVPRLAPDGRHLAYLAQDSAGRGHGTVVSVPDGARVYRGPAATMLETDAGVDAIDWPAADRFEIRIDLTYQVGGTQRIRGRIAPPATAVDVVVDTVRPPRAP